jgi:flagellar hook-associated protein 2
MSTSGVGSSSFTGSSSFSAQLQQVIQNAVSMASAPLQQLQSQQVTLGGQQTELNTIINNFQSLQTALGALGSATGLGSYGATVGTPSVASAQISSGVLAGTYSLNVVSVGSQTNTISKDGLTTVTDPNAQNLDSSHSYTLSINDKTYTINNSAGTLEGLAQAINNSGAQAQATVVNVGSSSSPDYRLSIQGLDYAPDTIQLNDGSKDLLNTLSTGSYVSYQVNGQPATPIDSSSRTINLSPGLNVQLLATGSTTITVAQNTSNVANSLNAFTSAYNSIVNELSKNRGQNGGALSGQSTIYELQNQLSNLASFSSGNGAVSSLADLGLTFDQNGNLQFDSSAFSAASSQSTNQVLDFLGSSTSGFLQAANKLVSAVTDPTTGILTQANKALTASITHVASQITDDQAKISQLQETLTSQMASVDATISSLEQQVNEVSMLFADMQQNAKSFSS